MAGAEPRQLLVERVDCNEWPYYSVLVLTVASVIFELQNISQHPKDAVFEVLSSL